MRKILLILSLFAFNIVVLLPDSDYFIGAYDPQHWAGITFSSKDKQGFGIFLIMKKIIYSEGVMTIIFILFQNQVERKMTLR